MNPVMLVPGALIAIRRKDYNCGIPPLLELPDERDAHISGIAEDQPGTWRRLSFHFGNLCRLPLDLAKPLTLRPVEVAQKFRTRGAADKQAADFSSGLSR